jgi:hypothetical protein
VSGDGSVYGDRFAGRRVDEKELFFDADSGVAGHGKKIDPARRISQRRAGSGRWSF